MNSKRFLIFTGAGKGKTTASIGTIIRALGYNWDIALIQFIKSREDIGEIITLRKFSNMFIYIGGLGFVPPKESSDYQKHLEKAQNTFQIAKEVLQKEFKMIVIDEIFNAYTKELLSLNDIELLIETFYKNPNSKCLIMTGRNAPKSIIEKADTVSEVKMIKHAFDIGIPAMEGIEK
jgi:cob(I)alamin adenosyltransferase